MKVLKVISAIRKILIRSKCTSDNYQLKITKYIQSAMKTFVHAVANLFFFFFLNTKLCLRSAVSCIEKMTIQRQNKTKETVLS